MGVLTNSTMSYLGNDSLGHFGQQKQAASRVAIQERPELPSNHALHAEPERSSQKTENSACLVPDKKLIKLRFEQAAATYEHHAQVQILVADKLLDLLAANAPQCAAPDRILEIGCCTGLLTEKISARYPGFGHLTASDLVDAFEHCLCQKNLLPAGKVTFLAGDIETIGLPSQYDLIISSSTLQWVHNLPLLCRKLARHCSAHGTLAISLYGSMNLREIRALSGMGLHYTTFDQLQTLVAAHFQVLAAEQSIETLWFRDAISVLQHLRATGVNSIGQKAWSRTQLKTFLTAYEERFREPRGVPLTYHPMYIIAKPRT